MAQPRTRTRGSPILFTGLAALRLIGIIGLIASAIFWWPVQSELTPNRIVAVSYTAGLVLAPPALWSFVFPWSPGGMLLFKIQRRTVGLYIVLTAALYFLYYSVQLQWSWWSAQPVAQEAGIVGYQVGVGILLYIVIPGLVWTPISREEFVTQVEQDQLVRRYELQSRADIAILDARMLRAQQLAAVGFANLLKGEREELDALLDDLIHGMDTTLQRVAGNANEAAQMVYGRHAKDPFSAPPLAEDLADILGYISSSIREIGPVASPPALAAGNQEVIDLPAQVAGDRGTVAGKSPPNVAPPRPAAPRRAPPRYAAEYDAARPQLKEMWTAAELGAALGKSDRTARDWLRVWEDAGLVARGDTKNNWYFTEYKETIS